VSIVEASFAIALPAFGFGAPIMARRIAAVNAHSWNITYWHDLKERRNGTVARRVGPVREWQNPPNPEGEEPMRRTLLISVAALALAAGGQALAQGAGGSGGGSSSGAGGGAAMHANPSGGSAATSGGASAGPGGTSGSMSGSAAAESKSTEPSTGAQHPRTGQATQPGSKQQQGQIEHGKGSRRGANERHEGGNRQGANERNEGNRQGANEPHEGTKQGANEKGGGSKMGANERGMKSSNVSLTTEQKTTIRERVLTRSAPRVGHVSFNIRVGTVVPRSVRFATLPPVLVEIDPDWRGYRYFVYHEEIVIVDPATLRIVAVLEV
jgi:hypothetical protein